MSLDLALLPLDLDEPLNWGFAQSLLECDLGGTIYDRLKNVETSQLPMKRFHAYGVRKQGEIIYGDLKYTPYGEPVRCVRVEQLLEIGEDEELLRSRRNRAVWAYLAQLDPKQRVALLWH